MTPDVQQVVQPAVAAALNAAHTQHPSAIQHMAAKVVAAHDVHPSSAAAKSKQPASASAHHPSSAAGNQQHKLKVEAELENAEHVRAMASAAAKKVLKHINIRYSSRKMKHKCDLHIRRVNQRFSEFSKIEFNLFA